jgi:hypothetical protein
MELFSHVPLWRAKDKLCYTVSACGMFILTEKWDNHLHVLLCRRIYIMATDDIKD